MRWMQIAHTLPTSVGRREGIQAFQNYQPVRVIELDQLEHFPRRVLELQAKCHNDRLAKGGEKSVRGIRSGLFAVRQRRGCSASTRSEEIADEMRMSVEKPES